MSLSERWNDGLKRLSSLKLYLGLQYRVLAFAGLSWLGWVAALAFYIPYVLLYAPQQPLNPQDEASIMVPAEDFFSAKIAAVVILFGLMVDSLLIAGLYQPRVVHTDLLVPWMLFYPVLALGLTAVTVVVAIFAEGSLRFTAAAPGVMVLVYTLVFFKVLKLYRSGRKARADEEAMEELRPIRGRRRSTLRNEIMPRNK